MITEDTPVPPMTPAEVAAEFALDRLGGLVHIEAPGSVRACGAVAGRTVNILSLAVTCARCLQIQHEGNQRLLAALRDVDEPDRSPEDGQDATDAAEGAGHEH